ncbi:MAG: hypothetical protein VKO00_10915 [Cyanobacteriota bacterium]|jgi:hypothetical protein|nr:hypothetical protein [Cyanobacteriota bacterium]
MIALIVVVSLVLALCQQVIQPLEQLLDPVLSLGWLGWVALAALAWLLAGQRH